MHQTVKAGRFFGWAGIVLDAALILLGLLNPAAESRASFARCQTEVQARIRVAPCPPPTDWPGCAELWSTGGSAFASGLFFLLLSGILAALLDLRADMARTVGRQPGPDVAIGGGRSLPARDNGMATPSPFLKTHLTETYGFTVGTRMLTEIRAAAARGQQLSEPDAKVRAEAWIARH